MSLARAVRPKEPRNVKLTLAAAGAMLVAYVVLSQLAHWSPKRGAGLGFGIAAALLFVFEMAYPWRRPNAWLLRTAKRWVQAHLYLGTLAFLAVVIHADFSWPRGAMGMALLLLTAWTSLSGLLGVLLQKWIPAVITENLRVEALYERIPELQRELLAEADEAMEGTSDVLARFYRLEVRPFLERPRRSKGFLLDVRGGRHRALEPFRRIRQFVDAAEQEKVDDLMAFHVEKLELDAHYSLQGILRGWLVLHVPPAAVLMALVVVHIASWLVY